MKGSVAPTPHLRRAGIITTIASLGAIALATLLPEPGVARGTHFCLLCGSLGGVSSILNVVLFIPLGVGLALMGVAARRTIMVTLAVSSSIEVIQLLAIHGRYATVSDVITNTLGGALGYALVSFAGKLLRPGRRDARNLLLGWSAIWLAFQAVSAFGFAIELTNFAYYGQLARVVGNSVMFEGRVMSATIGGLPVPNTALPDSRAVQRALENGALVEAKVTAATRARGTAPILRVADERNAEILLIAQKHNDLVFAVRTGASIVRLRPPLFGLPDAFEDSALTARAQPQSVLVLRARYDSGRVSIAAGTERTSPQRTIRASPSLSWTLLLPFQWVIEGTLTEKIVSLIWFACLTAPLGFWYARTNPSLRSRRTMGEAGVPLLSGAALLLVGLAVIPRWMGLSVSALADWLATSGGIALGYRAGTHVTHRRGD